MEPRLTDYMEFKDASLAGKYEGRKIPIGTLHEAYFDGKVDLVGDLHEMLRHRTLFTDYSITADQLRFVVTRLLPEVAIHSKSQDERIVRDHYDRGDDFFEAFLGPRMVYTSAFFHDLNETLEQAQDNKMDLVCQKLNMKPGDRYLDIGCGWGTLALHAARDFGADATGVTISVNQTEYGSKRIADAGFEDKARIKCLDYRDIPAEHFDRISCLEMAEHVGSKNFRSFMSQIYGLLEDDGLFYLQIAGPKRDGRKTNPSFGLFMSRYIFPGADAARKLTWVVDHLEAVGFEIHSVENVGIHYSVTIKRWYDNWLKREDEIVAAYGERWYRVWIFFLAWASHVAADGESTCFQIVCNKNTKAFDRTVYIGETGLGERAPNRTESREETQEPDQQQSV
jgi:cyclopropane fatty-acyl-phospholipid synthase-like methyltransferase